MKRIILLVVSFFSFAFTVQAQNTNVSATVTDSNSVVWANGTYTFNFIPNPRFQNGPYFNNGSPFTPVSISGSLSGTGSLTSVSVPSNSTITPSGTSWTVTYCPQATAPCQTSGPITITGASQTITSNFTPSALTIAPGPQVLVYNTNEVPVAALGAQVFLIGTGQQFCTAVTGTACTTWTSSGGGSVGSPTNPAAPIMAFYFSNVCPTANTGQCFFTASNTQIANDCTWASSATDVTCATSHFVAGDVGKRMMGFFKTDSFASTFGCVAGRITFSSMTTGTLTIASFTSGTHINLSANPSNAATGNNGCVIWGTPDDANAATFETAYAAVSAFCPKVMLAAAGYWFSSPHFSSQPTGCAALPSLVGQSTAYGNKVYTDGFELEGRGPGNTVIYLGDDFPAAGGNLCTNTEAGISGACFLVPVEGKWKDLQLSGGGQLACQVGSGKVLLGVAVGTLENIQLTNFCQNASGAQIGIEADLLAQLYQVDNSGFGAVCFQNIATTGGEIFAYKLACENSPGTGSPSNAVDIRTTTPFFPTFTCNGCLLVGVISSPSGTNSARCAAGSECHFVNTVFNNCEAGSGCVTPGSLMLRVDGTAYLSDVTMTAQGGVTGVGSIGCATAGGKVFLEKTNLSNLSSQNYFDNGGCTLTDLGGNSNIFTGLGTTAANFIGSYVGDGHSLTFTCTGTANASATDSLYNTGPNVTSTTCPGQTTTIGTGIPFTQARTIWGINCTSSATTVSVACKVLVNGATTNAPVCTMIAATHCIDFGHALAVNQGDLLSGEITTGAAETGANIKMQVIWGQ